MRHLISLDFDSRRIVSLHLPAFGAHVATAKDVDSSISFSHDYTVIDVFTVERCRCVDTDVSLGDQAGVGSVIVSTLGWLSDTIEAEYLHAGCFR